MYLADCLSVCFSLCLTTKSAIFFDQPALTIYLSFYLSFSPYFSLYSSLQLSLSLYSFPFLYLSNALLLCMCFFPFFSVTLSLLVTYSFSRFPSLSSTTSLFCSDTLLSSLAVFIYFNLSVLHCLLLHSFPLLWFLLYFSEDEMDWMTRAVSTIASDRMTPMRAKNHLWLKSVKIWIEI